MKSISCLIFLSLLLQMPSAFAAEKRSQEEIMSKSVARAWWNKEVTIDLLKLTSTQRDDMDESLRTYFNINQSALQAQKESFIELDAALFKVDNDRAQKTGEQIMDLLFKLSAEAGTTLFLITHDASLASRCDRVLHMRDGKLVRTST